LGGANSAKINWKKECSYNGKGQNTNINFNYFIKVNLSAQILNVFDYKCQI